MRNALEEQSLVVQRDVVEQHEVPMQLAEVADVGYDGDTEMLCQQAYGQEFADATDTQCVDLADLDSACLLYTSPSPRDRG